ncbi:hypothetical protein ACU6U9_11535 [Pseudomonas sp. HK3]
MELLDKIDPYVLLFSFGVLLLMGGTLSVIAISRFEKVSLEKGKGRLKIELTRKISRD